MKVKVSEAEGAALDWAVAKCEEEEVTLVKGQLETRWTDNGWKPSTDWSQAGPIIEREKIDVTYQLADECWCASGGYMTDGYITTNGPTPLIAAMRCYVTSKLGDEIDIPKELQ